MNGEIQQHHQEFHALYLELMKKVLTHSLWTERTRLLKPSQMPRSFKRFFVLSVSSFLNIFRLGLVRYVNPDSSSRANGEGWPEYAHTMIGLKRLDNIQYCAENIIRDDIPGDFIETGVWRGGAIIFMRAILKTHNIKDKKVWVADSFEGIPEQDAEEYPADIGDLSNVRAVTAVSLKEVTENIKNYGLLDDQIEFLPGWFKDTLPDAPIEKLSLIRLDGDLYQSTMESLENLYPKLTKGGYLIVDDYTWPACQQAVHDYRSREGITDPIKQIDNWGAYWRCS